jgi:hypothetical protein
LSRSQERFTAPVSSAGQKRLERAGQNVSTPGAVAAMARDIYDEWRMVHSQENFRD